MLADLAQLFLELDGQLVLNQAIDLVVNPAATALSSPYVDWPTNHHDRPHCLVPVHL